MTKKKVTVKAVRECKRQLEKVAIKPDADGKYSPRFVDKKFHRWMKDLHTFAVEKFGFPVGSLAEMAVRPGSIEETEWYEFYKMGMDPYHALIADSNGE
jgi:hypothetical protein